MPRNLTKFKSYIQVKALRLPHSNAKEQVFLAISRPICSAFSENSDSRVFKILLTMLESVFSRQRLRILSTHLMVRSTMARSVLESVLNQTLCLKALTLIFIRPCLVIKPYLSFLPADSLSNVNKRPTIIKEKTLLKVTSTSYITRFYAKNPDFHEFNNPKMILQCRAKSWLGSTCAKKTIS